jgi:hypothetical protein
MLIYIMKTSRHYMAQILSKVAIKTNNNTNIADEYAQDLTIKIEFTVPQFYMKTSQRAQM